MGTEAVLFRNIGLATFTDILEVFKSQPERLIAILWKSCNTVHDRASCVILQADGANVDMNAVEAMDGQGYSPGELTISSGTGSLSDVFVEVQDTGPGLDPADLDRLFQSFYTTKPDGMGLGLAISRSIVEAHGGRLSAAPNRPHGAVFRFTLPLDEPASEFLKAPH